MPTFRDDLHLGHSVPMVDTEDIVDGAVTEPKLADDSVSTRTIQDGAVTEPKIAEKAVTEPKLADAAVSTRTIKFRAVTESKIGDSAVSTRTIQNGAVTNPKIANGAVSMNKLDNETQTLIQRGADSSWTPMGDYDVDALYYANDLVFDPETNSSYLSLRADNMGHPVTDETWWMKVLDGSYVNVMVEELEQAIAQAIEDAQEDIDNAITGANTAAQAANTAAVDAEAKIDWVEEQVESLVAYEVDDELDEESIIPVQNKVVTKEINRINDGLYYEKNAAFGTLVNGFTIRSNGKWEKAPRGYTYSCYVHEVKEGDIYLLKVPDAEGSRIHYAFLTTYTPPVHLQDAPFVTGTSLNFDIIAGEKIRVTIPNTCKFLYIAKVYDNANIEPEYIHHILPNKNVIDNAIKEYDDILYYHTDAVNLSTLDIISGVAININDGLWAVTPNASSVFLERDGFDVIKIVPNSNSSQIAFLTSNSLPSVSVSGDTVDYCDGYDNAIRIEYEQYIHLPSDCKFVWLYNAYVDTPYLPQSIGLVRSVASRTTDLEKAGGGTLLTKAKKIRCIAPAMDVIAATSYLVAVNPCQKIKIAGATGFVWLKTDNIQIDSNPYEASDYFSGWCECDEDGVTLYAAPDANYLMVDTNVDVFGFEEYKDFKEHGTDLLSLASYIANRSVRYIYHTYIRTMHGCGYKNALTGIGSTNEFSHRCPAALVSHLDVMLNSPTLDLGLIGTTKYALRNQCIRYLQALVDAHSLWTNKWQSSLTAAYMGSASCRLYRDGYMTQELYDSIRGIVATECDNILNKQEGERWRNGSGIFGLYWKNTSGTEIYPGDSKSEEVGWYAGCLGVACALCQDYPNIQEYRRKFIEFCIISYASPSDIGKNESYNGYSLTNLQGSNITDDGMVINHQIIHPDYMASRCSVLFLCLRALNYANIKMPKAMLFNVRLVLSAFTDYKFTEGKYLNKYNILPPYGEIMKDGSNYPYFPMGNDWGTLRQDIEAEFFSRIYALGQSPRYDCSRTATNVLATIKKLQDRFETYHSGRIVANSSENSYGVEEAGAMQYANVGGTMASSFNIVDILTSDLVWSDDDWYNNE